MTSINNRSLSPQSTLKPPPYYNDQAMVGLINSLSTTIRTFYRLAKHSLSEVKLLSISEKLTELPLSSLKEIIDQYKNTYGLIDSALNTFIENAKEIFLKLKALRKNNSIKTNRNIRAKVLNNLSPCGHSVKDQMSNFLSPQKLKSYYTVDMEEVASAKPKENKINFTAGNCLSEESLDFAREALNLLNEINPLEEKIFNKNWEMYGKKKKFEKIIQNLYKLLENFLQNNQKSGSINLKESFQLNNPLSPMSSNKNTNYNCFSSVVGKKVLERKSSSVPVFRKISPKKKKVKDNNDKEIRIKDFMIQKLTNDIKLKNDTIHKSNITICQLKDEIKKYQNELKEKEEKIHTLKTMRNTNNGETFSGKQLKYQKEIESLKEKNNQMKAECDEATTKIKKMKVEMNFAVEDKIIQIQNLQEELSKKNQEVEQLNKKILFISKDNNQNKIQSTSNDKSNEIVKLNKEMNDKIGNYKKQIELLIEKDKKIQQDKQTLTKTIQEKEKENIENNKKLNVLIEEKGKEIIKLNTKIKDLINSNQNEVNKLNITIEELKNENEQKVSEYNKIKDEKQKEVENLNKVILNLKYEKEKEIEELTKKLTTLSEAKQKETIINDKYKSEKQEKIINENYQKINDLENELSLKNSINDKLASELQEKTNIIVKLNQDINQFTSQISTLKAKLFHAESELKPKVNNSSPRDSDDKRKKTKEDNDKLYQSYMNNIVILKNENEKFVKEFAKTKNELNLRNQSYNILQSQYIKDKSYFEKESIQKQNKLDDLKETLKHKSLMLATQATEIQNFTSLLKEKDNKLSNLEMVVKQKDQKINELQNKNSNLLAENENLQIKYDIVQEAHHKQSEELDNEYRKQLQISRNEIEKLKKENSSFISQLNLLTQEQLKNNENLIRSQNEELIEKMKKEIKIVKQDPDNLPSASTKNKSVLSGEASK